MGHTLQLGDAQVDENKLADLRRRYGVMELSLFGSAVRGEMRPGSDQVLKEARVVYAACDLLRVKDVRMGKHLSFQGAFAALDA